MTINIFAIGYKLGYKLGVSDLSEIYTFDFVLPIIS